MESESINILMNEHENILKIVDALEKESDSIKQGEINKDFFRKIIDFIRNYADRFHHAKEEDILFKEFCKSAEKGEVHCNPVEQMLYEHDLGRGFVKTMEQGVEENNKEKIIEGARGYIQLIREHIFKEDNILYPMSAEALNKQVQEEMLEKFKDIESKRKTEVEKYLNLVIEMDNHGK